MKYIDCPHCQGKGLEPGNDTEVCSVCHGEQIVEADYRIEEEFEDGYCENCDHHEQLTIQYPVYQLADGKEEYGPAISQLCRACYSK